MEERRDNSPVGLSRPPSALDLMMEAITSIQSTARETKEALTEVSMRLDRLESSPIPKFAVEAELNPGPTATTEQVDALYHSTIGLEEGGGARMKDPTAPIFPGTVRRSERLAGKAKIPYKEMGSRYPWPHSGKEDLNPKLGTAFPLTYSQDLPQRHEAPSFDDTMWATSVEARGGVTMLRCSSGHLISTMLSVLGLALVMLVSARMNAIMRKMIRLKFLPADQNTSDDLCGRFLSFLFRV